MGLRPPALIGAIFLRLPIVLDVKINSLSSLIGWPPDLMK